MRQRIKQLIMSLAIVLGFGIVALPAPIAGAINVDPISEVCTSSGSDSEVCKHADDQISTTIVSVINILLFIVGALSVVMIIIGGILYATSTGDSSRITAAKNTIMYAVIGLVVAFLAYAIVNWVLGALPKS